MVGYSAGVHGLEVNDKETRTTTSACYAPVVLLYGFVLERSLSMRMAVLSVWVQLHDWQEAQGIVLLEVYIISKDVVQHKVPLALCLLIQNIIPTSPNSLEWLRRVPVPPYEIFSILNHTRPILSHPTYQILDNTNLEVLSLNFSHYVIHLASECSSS
jgi:hypothetical protein